MGSSYGGYIVLEFDKAQKISKILTAQLRGDSPPQGGSETHTKKGDETKKKNAFSEDLEKVEGYFLATRQWVNLRL